MKNHHVTFRFPSDFPVKEITFVVKADSAIDAVSLASEVRDILVDGGFRQTMPLATSISTFGI